MSEDTPRKPRSKTVKNPLFTENRPKQVLADIARPRVRSQSLAEHEAEVEADKLTARDWWDASLTYFNRFRR